MTPWQFHGVTALTPTLITDAQTIGQALIKGWPAVRVRAALEAQYVRRVRRWLVLEQMTLWQFHRVAKGAGMSRAYVHSQTITAAFFKRAGISYHTPEDRKLIVRAWVEVAWPALAKGYSVELPQGYVQELLADFAEAQADVEAACNCWTDPHDAKQCAVWDAAVLKQAEARQAVAAAKAEFPHVFAQFAARFPESAP